MIKADTLLYHELIGLNIHILDDTSTTLTDVSGSIINETKNTFLIRTPRGTKMITKKNATKIRGSNHKKLLRGLIWLGILAYQLLHLERLVMIPFVFSMGPCLLGESPLM